MAPTKKGSSAGKAAGKAPPRSGSAAKHAAKPVARKAVIAKASPAKPAAKAAARKPVARGAVKARPKPAPKAAASKVTAKVVVPPAKPVKPPPKRKGNAAGLSPKDLDAIKTELLANRATLEKEFEDLEIGSLHVAQSELSGEVSFDEEYADAGTFTFERERDLSLSNNIRDLMDKVDTAMKRLADGSYGTCERCGRAIDKARLKALPYSVLCISCKKQEERVR